MATGLGGKHAGWASEALLVTRMGGQAGAALPTVLAVLVVVTLMGAGFVSYATKGAGTATDRDSELAAQTNAESGLESARAQIDEMPARHLYDGRGRDDLKWSARRGGKKLSFGRAAQGRVYITSRDDGTFRVVSEGYSGDAERRLDASIDSEEEAPPNEIGEPGPPVANDDAATTEKFQSVEINVLPNDLSSALEDGTRSGEPVYVADHSQPPRAQGRVSCASTCEFDPKGDFVGKSRFTYTVEDGVYPGPSEPATVTVTVEPDGPGNETPDREPPRAKDDRERLREDGSARLNVLGNDSSSLGKDALHLEAKTNANHGRVECQRSGRCQYSPKDDWNGRDSFEYVIEDRFGRDRAKVYLTVTPVAEPKPPKPDPKPQPDRPNPPSSGGGCSGGGDSYRKDDGPKRDYKGGVKTNKGNGGNNSQDLQCKDGSVDRG